MSQSIAKPIVTLRQANLTLGNGASSVHVLKGIDIDTVSYTHLTLPTIYSV